MVIHGIMWLCFSDRLVCIRCMSHIQFSFFFFNDTATTEIYTLSLHDALPISATETITSIILIKLIRVSLGTVRHPRRFKIVVIDIQITLKQMLRDFIGIRVNRAKKSGMVNITSSVNSRERSGINTILH